DWSSDVCSSDLRAAVLPTLVVPCREVPAAVAQRPGLLAHGHERPGARRARVEVGLDPALPAGREACGDVLVERGPCGAADGGHGGVRRRGGRLTEPDEVLPERADVGAARGVVAGTRTGDHRTGGQVTAGRRHTHAHSVAQRAACRCRARGTDVLIRGFLVRPDSGRRGAGARRWWHDTEDTGLARDDRPRPG